MWPQVSIVIFNETFLCINVNIKPEISGNMILKLAKAPEIVKGQKKQVVSLFLQIKKPSMISHSNER